MGLVNDKIQAVGFLLCCILQCFPYGILPPVSVFTQISGFPKLLRVQKVDLSILQHFHIKGGVLNGNALAEL